MSTAIVIEKATFFWDSDADQVLYGMLYRYSFLYRHQQEGACELPQERDGWVQHRILVWGMVTHTKQCGLKQATAKIISSVTNSISGD